MKAIIMAGGEGTRLRPLTCDCPKPMMRLMNRPVMAYAIELARRYGIRDIAVTLGYLPDAITDYFDDGSDRDVNLKYYVEDRPLGTAGGVKQASDFLDETFIVLSGDGVTDLDIARALEFHKAHRALATLVLKTVENPLEYGVVMTDERHRVTGFIEKPDPSNVFSAAANTGIYILEPEIFAWMPESGAYDFGSQLFPTLLRANQPIYGYLMDGYWCDIGDVSAYVQAHVDAMDGKINLPGLKDGFIASASSVIIHPTAQIERPCVISEGVEIQAHAQIGPYSVIGPGCVIGENASVKRSILWPNVKLHAKAQARGCVLGRESILEAQAQAYEGAVLGTSAVLSSHSALLSGVKLWPGKQSDCACQIRDNLIWGGNRRLCFERGKFPVDSPVQMMHAVQAFAALLKPQRLLLGRTSAPFANVLWHAAVAGAMAQGVSVIDAGVCTLPVLRQGMKALKACFGEKGNGENISESICAALIGEDGLIPLQSTGARLMHSQQRALMSLFNRQDFKMEMQALSQPVSNEGDVQSAYCEYLCKQLSMAGDCLPTIWIGGAGGSWLGRVCARISPKCFWVSKGEVPEKMGAGEVGILLDEWGEMCEIIDDQGPLTDFQRQMLAVWTALESGERKLLLPVSASRGFEILARDYGGEIAYAGGEPMLWQHRLAQSEGIQFDLHHDGLMMALMSLDFLARRGWTLGHWRQIMPDIHRAHREIPSVARHTGSVFEGFQRDIPQARLDCGVQFMQDGAWAWVCPDESQTHFSIVAEAARWETAEELCDFCERKIRKYCGNGEDPELL